MSQTLRRGPGPSSRRPVNRRRAAPAPSFGDRVLAKLPVSEEALRRAVTWSLLGVGGAIALAGASWAGVPAAVGAGIAEGAARAGLRVEQVDITGLKRMDRETVYAIALEDQPSRAILRVDLARVRERLLAYGWIADAYVSRRLPDRLVVHITEREPAAIWQNDGQLTLIDATGRLLAPVERDNMPNLPLVIGPGADRQEAGYQALLAAAPQLKRRVRAASWVGNRRWDITFDSGETLALPQDDAAAALTRFARMNAQRPLLGKGWRRFDMRDPAKLVARRPGQDAGQSLPDTGDDPGTGTENKALGEATRETSRIDDV